jgi:hypothetical protein
VAFEVCRRHPLCPAEALLHEDLLCFVDRLAGPQASQQKGQASGIAFGRGLRRQPDGQRRRQPDVRAFAAPRAVEPRRCDADDANRVWRGRRERADDIGAAAEGAGPEAVADDGDRLGTGPGVLAGEAAAANRLPQDVEVRRRQPSASTSRPAAAIVNCAACLAWSPLVTI